MAVLDNMYDKLFGDKKQANQETAAAGAAKINKDTIIGDVLDIAPETEGLFTDIGMHCLYCSASRGETVEEACAVHGIDADEFLEVLNETIASKRGAGAQ